MANPFLFLSLQRDKENSFLSSLQESEDSWEKRDQYIKISLQKRYSYPRTFFLQESHSLLLGYIEPELFPQLQDSFTQGDLFDFVGILQQKIDREFLIIQVGAKNNLKIYRDAICTIPIFYFAWKKLLVISNEFTALLPFFRNQKAINLDFTTLSRRMLNLLVSPERSILSDIKLLGERSILSADKNGVKIIYPPSEQNSSEKGEGLEKDFSGLLEKNLDKYWQKIPHSTTLGFELSGGLDSTTPVGFYSSTKEENLQTFSMILPGKEGQSQKGKIASLHQRFAIRSTLVPIQNEFPLKSHLKSLKPFYPFREIYFEALDKLARLAQEQGIEVMITGMGGDEAFLVDPGEENGYAGLTKGKSPWGERNLVFLTEKFKRLYRQSSLELTDLPNPLVPYSVLAANVARNNIYLARGIWPVAPLADPYFSSFCRRLPWLWRQDKKILRIYQERNQYPPSIYKLGSNETFAVFFENTMRSRVNILLDNLFLDSFLDKLGLIKKNILLKDYRHYVKTGQGTNPLYFYSIGVIEILLHYLQNS